MTPHHLHNTVSAGVLGSDEHHAELLTSIVEVARAIFQAKASSILLYDEDTDQLVFEAVAGEGSDSLVGRRFPSSTGIAGFVLVTGQPMIIEDLRHDPRFAKDLATSTGFVPEGLMAVPLLHEERTLGVLEVLDRPQNAAFSLREMDLLALFAMQAAVALDITRRRAACRPRSPAKMMPPRSSRGSARSSTASTPAAARPASRSCPRSSACSHGPAELSRAEPSGSRRAADARACGGSGAKRDARGDPSAWWSRPLTMSTAAGVRADGANATASARPG
jgi:putative methionine-R-sulfoxide reductase with GAF domain